MCGRYTPFAIWFGFQGRDGLLLGDLAGSYFIFEERQSEDCNTLRVRIRRSRSAWMHLFQSARLTIVDARYLFLSVDMTFFS